MKQLLLILGLSLGLAGCGGSSYIAETNAKNKQAKLDYDIVPIEGEYVSETVEGLARMPVSIYKYKGKIWKCTHLLGGACVEN